MSPFRQYLLWSHKCKPYSVHICCISAKCSRHKYPLFFIICRTVDQSKLLYCALVASRLFSSTHRLLIMEIWSINGILSLASNRWGLSSALTLTTFMIIISAAELLAATHHLFVQNLSSSSWRVEFPKDFEWILCAVALCCCDCSRQTW